MPGDRFQSLWSFKKETMDEFEIIFGQNKILYSEENPVILALSSPKEAYLQIFLRSLRLEKKYAHYNST